MKVFVLVLSLVSAALAGYMPSTPASLRHINTGSYGGTIGGYKTANSVNGGFSSNWVPGTSSGAVHTSGAVGNYAGGLSGHNPSSSGAGRIQAYTGGYSSGNNYAADGLRTAGIVNSGYYTQNSYGSQANNAGYSGHAAGYGPTSNPNYAKLSGFANTQGYVLDPSTYKAAVPAVQSFNSAGSHGYSAAYVNEEADQAASIGAYAAGQGFVGTHLPYTHANNVGTAAGYNYPTPHQQAPSIGTYNNHGNSAAYSSPNIPTHAVGQSPGAIHGYGAQSNNGGIITGYRYQPNNQHSFTSGSYNKGNSAAQSGATNAYGAAVPEEYAGLKSY